MTDTEAQRDELLALASIYDDSVLTVSTDAKETGGQFSASFSLPDPFFVTTCAWAKSEKSVEERATAEGKDAHLLKFLPPLILNFSLPPDYPSCSAPRFTLSCKWLTRQQLSALCQQLDILWERNHGMVVLFTWTSFLLDEAFDFLQLQSPLDISQVVSSNHSRRHLAEGTSQVVSNGYQEEYDHRGIQDIASQALLLPVLLDHDQKCRQQVFEKTIHSCQICFMDKFGSACLRFHKCDHVYCKLCMKNYFTLQIKEGNVNSLTCPSEKCDSEADPQQVKELVSPDLYARYDKLLLQTGLDMMLDIAYCPRPACGMPVLIDSDCNMARCTNCYFIFCPACKMVYHGLSPCRIRADDLKKIREEYLAADQGTKELLEKRYGKRVIQCALEESFSNEWLEKYSKQCPMCSTHIEKIDGCNKMTCIKCRAYFCWLCQAVLSRSNPYGHYNDPANPCNGQLFHGMEQVDDNDEDEGFFIAL